MDDVLDLDYEPFDDSDFDDFEKFSVTNCNGDRVDWSQFGIQLCAGTLSIPSPPIMLSNVDRVSVFVMLHLFNFSGVEKMFSNLHLCEY
ncbi:Hypothetical predicted protein, partial [Pelobates cultripes]